MLEINKKSETNLVSDFLNQFYKFAKALMSSAVIEESQRTATWPS